jgi:hypothetical protein
MHNHAVGNKFVVNVYLQVKSSLRWRWLNTSHWDKGQPINDNPFHKIRQLRTVPAKLGQ